MGHSLTQEQLEKVWVRLGSLFRFYFSEDWDDEEFGYIARDVQHIDITMLKKIFFYDVAPASEVPLMRFPPVYMYVDWYVDSDSLIKAIKERKQAIVHSRIRLLLYEVHVKYLRWHVKELWDKFEEVLIKYRRGDIYIAEGKVKYRDKSS